MYEQNIFLTAIYLPNDLTAEALSIISKNKNPSFQNTIDHEKLGRDLINYLNRPELIDEIFNQITVNYNDQLYSAVVKIFVETMTDSQIRQLADAYPGYRLLYRMVSLLLNLQYMSFLTADDVRKFIGLSMKIQRNLPPNPAVADKQSAGEIVPNNTGISDRFGKGHDGIHIRAPKEGGQVITIKALEGIVIRQYIQETPKKDNGYSTLYGVWVVLRDGKVAVYKDLKTVDSKITATLKQGNLYYNNGRVLSRLNMSAGDPIGTIFPWKEEEKKANINKSDRALHFTILKDIRLAKSYTTTI